MSVMVLQDFKSSPQKSRPLKSGHRRHGAWLAIEYSYKLGQKMNLNFSANYADFCRDSHIWVAIVFGINCVSNAGRKLVIV